MGYIQNPGRGPAPQSEASTPPAAPFYRFTGRSGGGGGMNFNRGWTGNQEAQNFGNRINGVIFRTVYRAKVNQAWHNQQKGEPKEGGGDAEAPVNPNGGALQSHLDANSAVTATRTQTRPETPFSLAPAKSPLSGAGSPNPIVPPWKDQPTSASFKPGMSGNDMLGRNPGQKWSGPTTGSSDLPAPSAPFQETPIGETAPRQGPGRRGPAGMDPRRTRNWHL